MAEDTTTEAAAPDAPEVVAGLVAAALVSETVEGVTLRFALPAPVAAQVRGDASDRDAERAMAACLLERVDPEPTRTAAEIAVDPGCP